MAKFKKTDSVVCSFFRFNFDVPNKVLYLAVKKQNSIHIGNITPQSLNYFLSKVYQS